MKMIPLWISIFLVYASTTVEYSDANVEVEIESAYNLSSTSITVVWKDIDESLLNGTLTKYRIIYKLQLSDFSLSVCFIHTNQTQVTVENLLEYTVYSFSVVPVTTLTLYDTLSWIDVKTDESTPKAPPENVSVSAIASTSVNVSWDTIPPDQRFGIIQGYVLQYYAKLDPTPVTTTPLIAAPCMSYLLTGLHPFTEYEVSVAGCTSNGNGNFSDNLNFTTTEAGPDAPPTSVILSIPRPFAIVVEFVGISEEHANGLIVAYVIKYWETDDATTITNKTVNLDVSGQLQNRRRRRSVPSTLQTEITVNNGNVLYSVQVGGVTVEPGNFSDPVEIFTALPDDTIPVLNVTSKSLSLTSIVVRWYNLSGRSDVVKQYTIVFNPVGVVATQTQTAAKTENEITLENLNQYTNYSIRVYATANWDKNGNYSKASICLTEPQELLQEIIIKVMDVRGVTSTKLGVVWKVYNFGPNVFPYQGFYVTFSAFSTFRDNKAHVIKIVGNSTTTTQISNLFKYTHYDVIVNAYNSTSNFSFSSTMRGHTLEDVPSSYPVGLIAAAASSTSIISAWDEVPQEHQNGIIIGYGIRIRDHDSDPTYSRQYDISNGSTLQYQEFDLGDNRPYEIYLWAKTIIGSGPETPMLIARTEETVPSGGPEDLQAMNHTHRYQLTFKWNPVRQVHRRGVILQYHVKYKLIAVGDIPIEYFWGNETYLDSHLMEFTIVNACIACVYEIEVAAINKIGQGPSVFGYGETCRCEEYLLTNWRHSEPYFMKISPTKVDGVFPLLLEKITNYCCSTCQEFSNKTSGIDFFHNANGTDSQQSSDLLVKDHIDDGNHLSFPVYAFKGQENYGEHNKIVPLMKSAGVVFMIMQATGPSSMPLTIMNSMLASYPLILVNLFMAIGAGLVIWFLDSPFDRGMYPRSFHKGAREGVWWSCMTMTTVGYGDKTANSIPARLFAMLWILIGLVLYSMLLSNITTAITMVVFDEEMQLYGTTIAALDDSPEYRLGVRRNAKFLNKSYGSEEQVLNALYNEEEVKGALIDSFTVGTKLEQIKNSGKPVAINSILNEKFLYGVVLGGEMAKMHKCFGSYLQENAGFVSEHIKEKTTLVKLSDAPGATQKTTGLFDPDSELFKTTMYICVSFLIIAVILGSCWEYFSRKRSQHFVHAEHPIYKQKEAMIKEMREIVQEFRESVVKLLEELQTKHRRQQKTLIRMYKQERRSMGRRQITFIKLKDIKV